MLSETIRISTIDWSSEQTTLQTRAAKQLFILKEADGRPVCDEHGFSGHESSANPTIQACQRSCSAQPSRRAHDMQPNFPLSRSGRFWAPLDKGVAECGIGGVRHLLCGLRTISILVRYGSLGTC